MRVSSLATDVTTDTSQTEVNVEIDKHREGVFQTEFEGGTGTGNVILEGRLTPVSPWETIVTHTGTNADTVALFAQMRVRTTSLAGGATINCWLQHG